MPKNGASPDWWSGAAFIGWGKQADLGHRENVYQLSRMCARCACLTKQDVCKGGRLFFSVKQDVGRAPDIVWLS